MWEYAPLKSHGWACIEILAKDPDTLARTLPDRGFQVIGPPNDLPGQPGVRAMQAIGPGGVCYYFTRVGPEGVAAGLPQARAQIDRVFVIVLGASSLETSIDFYCRTLDAARPQTMPARISVLSRAHELDPETRHNLAVIVLDQFFIEIDQYPTSATARPTHPSDLAPGFSFPSFMVDGVATRSPYACDLFGYEGYKATIVIGPDGRSWSCCRPSKKSSAQLPLWFSPPPAAGRPPRTSRRSGRRS